MGIPCASQVMASPAAQAWSVRYSAPQAPSSSDRQSRSHSAADAGPLSQSAASVSHAARLAGVGACPARAPEARAARRDRGGTRRAAGLVTPLPRAPGRAAAPLALVVVTTAARSNHRAREDQEPAPARLHGPR
jgi:hypothetical protein